MMSTHKKRSVFFGSLFLLSMLWSATGCIKDEHADCLTTYQLHVRAYASVGGDDISSDVDQVILYIFDNDNRFVEQITTRVGESVPVGIPNDESITVIAWGNLSNENQTCPVFYAGDPIGSGSVLLSGLTRSAMAVKAPDNLFYGTLVLSQNDLKNVTEIPMYRKTGRMNITIRGLKQYFGFDDNDYSIRVNTTNRGIAFDGTFVSGNVVYLPHGEFNEQNVFVVPSFNMLANENISVDILHAGNPVGTITTSGGAAIGITEGLTTNLLINYMGSLNVTVSITNWDTEAIWKDY